MNWGRFIVKLLKDKLYPSKKPWFALNMQLFQQTSGAVAALYKEQS
jgi:hypothetical protein